MPLLGAVLSSRGIRNHQWDGGGAYWATEKSAASASLKVTVGIDWRS